MGEQSKYDGWILELCFLDHTESLGRGNACPTVCYGEYAGEDEHSIFLGAWVFDNDIDDDENRMFTVVKGTLLREPRKLARVRK